MIYLDTSAFLKLYILEPGSPEVNSRVVAQDSPLPVWDLLEAEFTNALRLKVFWKEIIPEQADTQIALFHRRKQQGFYHVPEVDRGSLMSRFHELSRVTPRLGCRTLDILHVACATLLAPATFLTFDARQRELARHAGLNAPDLS